MLPLCSAAKPAYWAASEDAVATGEVARGLEFLLQFLS